MKIYNTNGNRFVMGYDDIDVVKYCDEYDCDGYLKINGHEMEIINRDNSKANLCVNGLHCFTKFLYDIELDSKEYDLKVNNIIYPSKILNVDPFISKVRINPPKIYKNFVDIGNQHMIIIDDDMSEAEYLCKRYDCNINYVKIIDRNHIEVVTYERGVGYTLSCGSGNTSSAYYCYENGLCDKNIKITNRGGGCEIYIDKYIEITSISHFEREL